MTVDILRKARFVLAMCVLSGCNVLDVGNISRRDFQDTEAAFSAARKNDEELGLILQVQREYEPLKYQRSAQRAWRTMLIKHFEGTQFNGAVFHFLDARTYCPDDSWHKFHTIVWPLKPTKRKVSRLIGEYCMQDADGQIWLSRTHSQVDGVLHYEYRYDVFGPSSDAWMTYFIVGDPVPIGGPAEMEFPEVAMAMHGQKDAEQDADDKAAAAAESKP